MRMNVINEAKTAYSCGRLVPFVGSGLSRKVCRSWTDMIEALEQLPGAGDLAAGALTTDDFSNANRAARALERRRLGLGIPAAESVREALLEGGPAAPPHATAALAALHWPLVLSTNYDDLYVAAVHQRQLQTHRYHRRRTSELERRTASVRVVGRSSVDCHRVACALSAPAPPLLWALQGYLGGQATATIPREEAPVLYAEWAVPYGAVDLSVRGTGPGLESEIVVGHADYRRVALRSESFRRTFAEVFRQRSLLFLGSSLTDRYLLDLFSQIIELTGPNAYPHYAIMQRDALDPALMQRNFGIWVHEITEFDEIPDLVRQLHETPPTRRYAYRAGSAQLTVDTAPLPLVSDQSACVVLSGGGTGRQPRLEDWAVRYLSDSGYLACAPAPDEELLVKDDQQKFVWRLSNPVRNGPLVLVARSRLDPLSPEGLGVNPVSAATAAARDQPGQDNRGRLWRDFRVTAAALQEVLAVAHSEDRHRVVTVLLASGGLRTVPGPIMLQAMLQAWSTTTIESPPSLTVHVIDEDVQIDLESRRVDATRFLPLPETAPTARPILFWLELVPADSEIDRILVAELPHRPIIDLLSQYGIDGERWLLTIEPIPCLGWDGWRLAEISGWRGPGDELLSLERIGVLHGSTIQLREVQAS
jgi:hypothetical protein